MRGSSFKMDGNSLYFIIFVVHLCSNLHYDLRTVKGTQIASNSGVGPIFD